VAARLSAFGDERVTANDLGHYAEASLPASPGVPLARRTRGTLALPGGSQANTTGGVSVMLR
jgi:hypothetical protein